MSRSRWIIRWAVALALGTTHIAAAGLVAAELPGADYQALARQTYADGVEDLEGGHYIEAERRFQTVRNRFPYSQFAALAELRLADTYHAQGKYIAAIEQYRSFQKLHPNHDQAVYAAWRTALSFYRQMPDEWFFLPPAHELEQSKTRDAERELRYFMKRHPGSEFEAEAQKALARVRRRLADHELYVAEFYLERDNPRASALRLQALLERYSGHGLDARALFLLGRSYLLLGDTAKAKIALEDLIEHHGADPLAEQARDYLSAHAL